MDLVLKCHLCSIHCCFKNSLKFLMMLLFMSPLFGFFPSPHFRVVVSSRHVQHRPIIFVGLACFFFGINVVVKWFFCLLLLELEIMFFLKPSMSIGSKYANNISKYVYKIFKWAYKYVYKVYKKVHMVYK